LATLAFLCLGYGHVRGGQQMSLDAVILMDDSGSMRKTDPLQLRLSALSLLIHLLRDDDAVGIVTFDDAATVAVPLRPIGAAQERRTLQKAALTFSARGAYTNIYAGLNTALQEMQRGAREHTEKVVILISDGLMDVNPASGLRNEDALRLLHASLLPEYADAQVKIITLALSPGADRVLLSDLAQVTGGRYFYTPQPEELSQALFGIVDALKSPDLVPVTGQRAILDAAVKEATFFIATDVSKGDVTLVRPDGVRLARTRKDPTARWFVGKDYLLCTIQRPAVGEWRIDASGARPTKVVVITDLRLEVVVEQKSYAIGQEARISARLVGAMSPQASTLPLAGLTFTGTVIHPGTAAVATLLLSGQGRGRTEPAIGEWHEGMHPRLTAPGEYRGSVTAVAPTFRREKSFAFRVLAPLQDAGASSQPPAQGVRRTAPPLTPDPRPLTPSASVLPVSPPPATDREAVPQEMAPTSPAPSLWLEVRSQFAMAHGVLLAVGAAVLLARRWVKGKRRVQGDHAGGERP